MEVKLDKLYNELSKIKQEIEQMKKIEINLRISIRNEGKTIKKLENELKEKEKIYLNEQILNNKFLKESNFSLEEKQIIAKAINISYLPKKCVEKIYIQSTQYYIVT